MHWEIADPMNFHVGLYIRLSKEDENEGPSESVSNQRSLLNAFVKEHRLNVYDTYVDDGWSGTHFHRPGFMRMIGDIEAGNVNMVITKDLSRLGRDYIMTGHYMERYFPEKRVRYLSLLDGIDTGVESSANDITPFRAIMNDMYAKDISKKIKSVKHDKQRRGLFIGGKATFGYKLHPSEKNKIIIDDKAALLVRRIFQMALEGTSCRRIAVSLNAEHVPTPAAYAGLNQSRTGPYAGLWSGERISEMLQNETYLGSMVQGKSAKLSYKSQKCVRKAREDWVIVENTHEPIIDPDTFRQVRMLIDSRKTTRQRVYDFLLKGLIFCHECGYPLSVLNRKNAVGEDCLYFVCRTYQRFTKAGVCSSHSIKEKTVTDAVLAKVKEVCAEFLQPDALLKAAELKANKTCLTESREREYAALRFKIDHLNALSDRTYLDHLRGALDDSDFARIYQQLRDERRALEQSLSAFEQSVVSLPNKEDPVITLVRRFTDSAFSSRELLVSLIERVELTKDRQIILRFRFPQPE
jgi:DNA invertase Pin-like site-specific DNA recombinase